MVRLYIVHIGPEHMRDFATDQKVMNRFCELALKQSSFPSTYVSVLVVAVLI